MDHRRWHEGPWFAWALGGLMLLVAGLDLAFPSVAVLPALVVLVMAAALLVSWRATAWLAGLALVLMLIGGLAHGDYAGANGWINLVAIIVAGVIAVLLSLRLESQRGQVLEREAQYRLLAENASDIVARVALDGTLEWISPSVKSVLGHGPESLIGTHPWDLVHPDDRVAAAASLADAASPGHQPVPLVTRVLKSDGSYVWLSASAGKAPDGPFVVSFRQVDDEVAARQALVESQTHYRLLAENAMDMVFSLDMHAVIDWVSQSSLAMLGYEPDELAGRFGGMLVHADDLPLLLDAAAQAREGTPASCEIRMLRKDGDVRWVEATPRGLFDETGVLSGGVIGVRDIHEEVLARQAALRAGDYDKLTGLANAASAIKRIQAVLESRDPQHWALLCVGVAGMTAINQAYTYAAGDSVLIAVAQRLAGAVDSNDTLARIAGDEFVVLLGGVSDSTDAASAAARFLTAVRGHIEFEGVSIEVSACAGVALAGGHDAQALVRDATAAMRQASAKGRDRWEFLDGDVGEQARSALALQVSLRGAIAGGHIHPWFMPIVSLSDGHVVGYEALARWRREHGAIALPADFLATAERTGLIVDIDRLMLERSMELLREQPGIDRLAVNVSAAMLGSGSLTGLVIELLGRSAIDPRRLHLEVTETSLLQVTDGVRCTMQELADLGVAWWVDDFGTGFSSISHLRDLPITGLKLDQSFTTGLTFNDTPAVQLSRGLVGLASGLGLQTVAEGIETVEQSQVLQSQGWICGQGWLFGRPMPEVPTPA